MNDNYENELAEELKYFAHVKSELDLQLSQNLKNCDDSRDNLISSKKEIWDDTAHSLDDFDRAVESSQYLEELNAQTSSYLSKTDEIQKLKKMEDSPYFARIDFTWADEDEKQKIYIGRYSLIDDVTHQIFVFDWRSPIASIFYQFGLGNAQYQAPNGVVHGNVSLKRQYEIKHGKFEYFFDANVQIVDKFLRKILSKNASPKMTAIVETIQKDQDIIIRDSKNELLMVQGVAGSGKTSVALHRIAYLMYQGLSSNLSSYNIVILSPNSLFAKYISNVLPELGEDNVETWDFDEICNQVLEGKFQFVQTRNQFFENLITCTARDQKELIKSSLEFKTSNTFIIMLKRLAIRYERKLIQFSNIYYNHRQLFDRELLKAELLKRDAHTPTAVRLKQIESMILQKIREENKTRLIELERFIDKFPEHMYESKEFARMLSIRENRILISCIHKFTEIDYLALYRKMFYDKNLFYTLAKGLKLPDNMERIRQRTNEFLLLKTLQYEDALAIAFLKIKMDGSVFNKNIKHVIIDEAQDYYPIHFEILNRLFPKAKYTVLGDVNQTIEKQTSPTFYEDIQRILNKKSAALLTLSKSFRCTNQIIAFSAKFIDKSVKQDCFSRDGTPPEIISCDTKADLDRQLITFAENMRAQGYRSICILCKSLKESSELYDRIKDSLHVVLMDDTLDAELSGTIITSIYMAKGLEFDVALVYNTDDINYQSADDKNLLYIATTRALHRLALFYSGQKSRFLNKREKDDVYGGSQSDTSFV
jgi:DNA helicase-2/ATP-dependent DNA helicase PcrA